MYYQRIAECCSEIGATSEMINDLMVKMQESARKCDYDEHTEKWILVVLLTETLDENSLFPSLDCDYSFYHGMLKGIESLDASCFYGRTFGVQFAPSVTSIFNAIGIILATCSLSWESGTTAFSSLDKITKLQANKWITLSYKISKIHSNRSPQIFFDVC
ncbi:HSL-N domain-containing protein [Aphelenchoides besseyi]|nr:HSL-N domain-containing protein [Aphelenchoides besseyi]